MFLNKMLKLIILISLLCVLFVCARHCSDWRNHSNFKFYLLKPFQRSVKERLFVDNVHSLKACVELARKYKGMAFNYSPKERFFSIYKDSKSNNNHYWDQPHLYFNCHILQCPENAKFKTIINDFSFDYYSLYPKSIESSNYICLAEVGLFFLQTIPQTFQNASSNCQHSRPNCGALAHVGSQKRTEALSHLIRNYNEEEAVQVRSKIYLAYIDLHYNRTWSNDFEFFNSENDNLKCFAYLAWEPGSPKKSLQFVNESCVALTVNRTWRTVKCDRKLPYICEILAKCENEEDPV